MKKLIVIAGAALALGLASCGFIETGHVGVRSQFGSVSMQEEGPGFYTSFLSSVWQYTTKEVVIDLNDLTPKAKDNLSLKDMDVSVFFKTTPTKVAELETKYTGQSYHALGDHGPWVAGYGVVMRQARSTVYEEVAKHDSLIMHTVREEMENALLSALQKKLDSDDPGSFTVTKVIIRSVVTDQSIEEQIRKTVASQKELEQKSTQVEITKKDAQITVEKARGVAEAQRIIHATLTREYLQHEQNQAMLEFAKNGQSTTVMFPYNTNVAPLINIK